MGDFSLIPSFIVFAIVIAAFIVGSALLRRRARRRLAQAPAIGRAPARVEAADLVRNANIQLVQMDDAIRSAEEELQFALAEFGEQSTHEFADALATAKKRAAEAFALKQRLDDAYADTEQQQRDWSKRILALSDSALALVTAQSREFDSRRRLETSAPDALRRLSDDVASGRARIPAAVTSLAALGEAYAENALTSVAGNDIAASEAFDEADRLVADARGRLAQNALAPVAKLVHEAESLTRRGAALLDAVERMRESLTEADQRLQGALQAATGQLAEAQRLRDSIEDPDAVARIVEAAAHLDGVARTAAQRSSSRSLTGTKPELRQSGAADRADPVADLDALATALARLDETLAVARTAQQRLDSARAALVGALEIAASHIRTASDYIAGRRGRVGPDARTRLAAAERELALARLEADPVAALDGARRAATLATDADALARYDASGLSD
jgi:hypothetical protein